MIRPHVKRDWFQVDRETAKPVWGLPGVDVDKRNPSQFLLHRSHLALFDAAPIISTTSATWEARNIWTAARGFKLRTAQQQAIDFISQRAGAVLADDMRIGKGHPSRTKILGPDGWRSIGDVRVGDQVFGSDGKLTEITGVFPRGVLPVFRVSFSDGASILVDGDHLWTVWDHNDWHRGRPPRTLATSVLAPQLRDANNLRWRIPLVAPLAFPKRELPIDPYLLGVLLGDGSLSQGSISFCCGDEEVPREVARVLPNDVKLTCTRSKNRAPTWRIVECERGNSVARALNDLGLRGSYSATKFVPSEYLFSAPDQRLALLQGLLDTDGEWSGGRLLQFSSASEELRDAVRFLVESLGGVGRISLRAAPRYAYKGEEYVGAPSYRLTIALPHGIEPFRARAGYLPRQKFQPTRHIKSIEAEGETEVICISVSASDQLYVTERCIVTHNTLSSLMCHDPARGPLVIIAPLSTRAVWLGWARRVFPEAADRISALIGRKFDSSKIYDHPIVFAHYDIIKHWQTDMRIGTLILDEAHALTNPDARRTIAANFMRSRAEVTIPMTGTPIWKLPPDFWSVLQLAVPGAWGSHYDFAQRYGRPESTAYGPKYTGVSNEAELNIRLSEVMLRRRWMDIATDLPPITRSVVIAEVNAVERKRLDILAAKLASERTSTAANLAHYRRVVSKIKLADTVREARRITACGERVVVWTWHKDYANALAAELDAFVIHGDVAPAMREFHIDAWRVKPGGILVATLAVAQVGIDLSAARCAIFAEIDYTPAVIGQAEMRTFDSTRSMDVIFVVAAHFIDQRIIRALVNKLGAADPLGVGAAIDAIDAMRDAVLGPVTEGDVDRLLEDFLASAV